MVLQLKLDQESYQVLKELLRSKAQYFGDSMDMSMMARRDMQALRRVYDQIRDREYSDV